MRHHPHFLACAFLCAAFSGAAADDKAVQTAPPDPALKAAREFALRSLPGQCDNEQRTDGSDPVFADNIYPLEWRYSYDKKTDPEHRATLYEIFCMAGAYNVNNVYVIRDEQGQLSLVSFAVPKFDVQYARDDKDTYTKLKSPPRVTGMTTTYFLTNADFDPKTRCLSSFDKWRGLGDAWDAGTWTFEEGEFVLTRYEIDPIYEANLDHPSNALKNKSFKLFPPSKKN